MGAKKTSSEKNVPSLQLSSKASLSKSDLSRISLRKVAMKYLGPSIKDVSLKSGFLEPLPLCVRFE